MKQGNFLFQNIMFGHNEKLKFTISTKGLSTNLSNNNTQIYTLNLNTL